MALQLDAKSCAGSEYNPGDTVGIHTPTPKYTAIRLGRGKVTVYSNAPTELTHSPLRYEVIKGEGRANGRNAAGLDTKDDGVWMKLSLEV